MGESDVAALHRTPFHRFILLWVGVFVTPALTTFSWAQEKKEQVSSRLASSWVTAVAGSLHQDGQVQQPSVKVDAAQKKVVVTIGDKLFAEYDYGTYAKPILYPVIAPGQVPITRHFPMKKDVPSEAPDHPHHKSVWFAHGDVNGVDFWSEKGSIVNTKVGKVTEIEAGDDKVRPGFTATHDWLSGEQKICSDTTFVSFDAADKWRSITYRIVMHASEGDIRFGDTKEGTFAVRTHPALRLIDSKGETAGRAVNSEGVEGKSMWGQKAKWVYYTGEIGGKPFGLAIFDHPSNLRHPTTWHARDYGLIGANPFGLHHFKGAELGTGDYLVEVGEQLSFRYRILITSGRWSPEQIEQQFSKYAATN